MGYGMDKMYCAFCRKAYPRAECNRNVGFKKRGRYYCPHCGGSVQLYSKVNTNFAIYRNAGR